MNKYYYYTPTIEEFHVGFEYEAKAKGSIETSYSTFIWHGNNSIVTEFNSSNIRVKYLDFEDIESLGFEQIEDYCFNLPLKNNDELRILFERKKMIIFLADSYSGPLFQGYIKNKSELVRLLKQLGI